MDALHKVTIFRGPCSWMVDFRDDPTGPETLELFGSTILPLPYTLAASLDKVVLALRRQHPAIVITFADYAQVARPAVHA
jgi:hypothetical protein